MWTDLKFALRMLAKNRLFTAIAICSLAIGIGANSAIFSFADAILLRPLPIPKPDALYNVVLGKDAANQTSISYPEYRDFRDRNHSFDGLIAYQYAQFSFGKDTQSVPRSEFGAMVSGNFFQVLGIQPALGRTFRADEDRVAGRDPVAIVSHAFWVSQLNADPGIIGKKIRLNGLEFTAIGVAPESFKNMDQFLRPALYVPIAMSALVSGQDNLEKRDKRWLTVKGRLKPGVTAVAAQADLENVARTLKQFYPDLEPRHSDMIVQTELQLRAAQSPADSVLVQMLLLLAFCVLLVACANVAGLLLARATVRGREISVRLAVGAARWQLLRQLVMENLLLAIAGGATGIFVALAAMKLFESVPIPTGLPVAFDFGLDRRLLLFTMAVAIGSSLLFGFVPAWRGSRADISTALKTRTDETGPRAKLWGRNILVSAQLALSCLLLILSTVIFVGFKSKLKQGAGFRTDRLFLMQFDTASTHYTEAQTAQFYKKLLNDARNNAGIKSAALSTFVPFGFDSAVKPVIIEGASLRAGEDPPSESVAHVTDGYFETAGISIVRGRAILPTDTADSARVAVINEQFARRFWPGQNAIGKRFRVDSVNGPMLQVVGIAKQSKYFWISEQPQEFFYIPSAQDQPAEMTLYAESRGPSADALGSVLRQIVHRIDRNMPVFDARTMKDVFEKRAVETPAVLTEMVGGMGLMAFVLALAGLYGLITYTVNTRRREIGIRMAIGAQPRDMVRGVLRQAMILTGIGGGCGLAIGVAASLVVRSTAMFASGPVNPLTFALVLTPLLVLSLLAAYGPARRASQIDPVRVLREE